jgi:hypothetical protein
MPNIGFLKKRSALRDLIIDFVAHKAHRICLRRRMASSIAPFGRLFPLNRTKG